MTLLQLKVLVYFSCPQLKPLMIQRQSGQDLWFAISKSVGKAIKWHSFHLLK